ncbi:MAG TPA: rod shape-determining protein MreD [Gammaproteobacteria bacterium]|nr:rod shape-determining protein MreD [Candidatus Parabeggiatoa sp.]HAI69407.1 rod shape-determining protein MreD [Gammaproteobacteria bacterium]
MSLERHHGGWVIIVSFIFSFMLAVMPLPPWAVFWRPDWVAMVLIYWCIAIPQRIGVTTGWFVGIIHDVLSDTLLGQHALTFTLIAYLSVRLHRQLRLFPWWQQSIGVFVFLAISQLPSVWIRSILGYPQEGWGVIYSATTTMILWRWLFIRLRDLRRTYRVF